MTAPAVRVLLAVAIVVALFIVAATAWPVVMAFAPEPLEGAFDDWPKS